jgi:hypothetical protein
MTNVNELNFPNFRQPEAIKSIIHDGLMKKIYDKYLKQKNHSFFFFFIEDYIQIKIKKIK